MEEHNMKFDITQLLVIFDELLPMTNEEQKIYWFKSFRSDNLYTILALSIYEEKISISIYNTNSEVAIASMRFRDCMEINVLDEKNKQLEIIHKNTIGRCFLSLSNDPILEYTE